MATFHGSSSVCSPVDPTALPDTPRLMSGSPFVMHVKPQNDGDRHSCATERDLFSEIGFWRSVGLSLDSVRPRLAVGRQTLRLCLILVSESETLHATMITDI